MANVKGNMLARRQKGGKVCRMEMNHRRGAKMYGRKPVNVWLAEKQKKQEESKNDGI